MRIIKCCIRAIGSIDLATTDFNPLDEIRR